MKRIPSSPPKAFRHRLWSLPRWLPGASAVVIALLGCAAMLLPARSHAAAAPTLRTAQPGMAASDRPPAFEAANAWWQGFEDPTMDALMRSARDVASAQTASRTDLEIQIGMRYLTARWLAARLALSRELVKQLAQRRHWITQDGPTPQAAKALQDVDALSAKVSGEIDEIATQCDAIIAQLRERSSLPPPALYALLEVALTQASVPQFQASASSVDGPRTVASMPDAALRGREAEVDRLRAVQSQRVAEFDLARKRLEAGLVGERAVAVAYERVLMNTDVLLNAQVSLAAEWMRAASSKGVGVGQMRH